MKKLTFFFAIAILISSCSLVENLKTSVIDEIQNATKVEVAADDLPTAAWDYLDETYFDTYIDIVNLAEDLGYQITLGTGEDVFFDTDGENIDEKCNKEGKRDRKGKKNLTSLDIAELNTTITDYITENYADATIKGAKSDENGSIYVGLDTHIILEFDSEGNFVGEFEHHRRGKSEKIELSELPTLITDYITTNYVDAEVKVAFKKDEGYGVGIVTADDERKVLVFDAEGNFIEEKVCNGK